MKKFFWGLLVLSVILFFAQSAFSHCEIPCGIYDDEMRINTISEHIVTIEKSMNQINDILKERPSDSHQLVRWIINKEQHAKKLQEIVTQYFMTQRIKPDTKNYDKKLALLHQMLVFSMKSKQTTDLSHVNKLNELVKDFKKLYFSDK